MLSAGSTPAKLGATGAIGTNSITRWSVAARHKSSVSSSCTTNGAATAQISSVFCIRSRYDSIDRKKQDPNARLKDHIAVLAVVELDKLFNCFDRIGKLASKLFLWADMHRDSDDHWGCQRLKMAKHDPFSFVFRVWCSQSKTKSNCLFIYF